MEDVAVVGAGVAGLAAAYRLTKGGAKVTLYEASDKVGGHADTQLVAGVPVDVGFMVFNRVSYPNMCDWFEEMGVPCQQSDMSFSVSKIDSSGSRVEWSSCGLGGFLSQRWRAISPLHWRMLSEMQRFEREANRFLVSHSNLEDESAYDVSLGEFVRASGFSDYFIFNYLVPICSSIWSTPGERILECSARCIFRFLRNHHMLQIAFRPRWLTVRGRSKAYVQKVCDFIRNRGGDLKCNSEVRSVHRRGSGVEVVTTNGDSTFHGKVILACHAPDSLAMLGEQATDEERSILGGFEYHESKLFLHRDASLMPSRKSAWASWNFLSGAREGDICLTYWLNRLQSLGDVPDDESFGSGVRPVLVTLNPATRPRGIVKEWRTSHPVPSQEAYAASQKLHRLQGHGGIFFCGAYEGFGFHEDGACSGFRAAKHALSAPVENALRPLPRHMLVYGFSWILREVCLSFFSAFMKEGTLIVAEDGGDAFTFGDGSSGEHGPCTILVRNPSFYKKLATRSDLGIADAYIDGDIELKPSIRAVLELAIYNRDVPDPKTASFRSERSGKRTMPWLDLLMNRASGLITSVGGSTIAYWKHLLRANSLRQARQNISSHYDLSNGLFRLFLDPTMTYSCGVFQGPDEPLQVAQERKLKMLADRARVQEGDHVLDIGFGWGSLAIILAKEFGCKVTGITLSKEQLDFTDTQIRRAGLSHLVELRLEDYRLFTPKHGFDRIMSCEMLEAVGHEYLGEFFHHCDRLLKPEGLLVIQVITTPEVRYETYKKSSDFIKEYIFPGACCPSVHALVNAAAKSSTFTLEQASDIAPHYSTTLLRWRENFMHRCEEIRKLGFSDSFIRCWDYYFQYCAAGFNTRTLGDMQMVFTRTGNDSVLGRML